MAEIVISPARPPIDAAAERRRCAAILNTAAVAARMGIRVDAEAAIRRGVSGADLARDAFDVLAQRDEARAIVAIAPPTPAGTLPGEDPYRTPGASRDLWRGVYARMRR